jgi:hypothetical protein
MPILPHHLLTRLSVTEIPHRTSMIKRVEFLAISNPLQLLRSPTFHRAVGVVHRKVHQIRTGEKPPERGGTSIEGM